MGNLGLPVRVPELSFPSFYVLLTLRSNFLFCSPMDLECRHSEQRQKALRFVCSPNSILLTTGQCRTQNVICVPGAN